jgi:polyisoprenoid-binding protein YceI
MSAALIEIPRYVTGTWAIDPAAGVRAGFTAIGEINRMDFSVSYNGPVPGGGVLLAEKVQIILEIEAALLPSGAVHR